MQIESLAIRYGIRGAVMTPDQRTGPMVVSWSGPGSPWWDGQPRFTRVMIIHSLTMKLESEVFGRWRENPGATWQRLRSAESYRLLNRATELEVA